MFYHVIIKHNEKVGKEIKNKTLYGFDYSDLEKIKSDLITPFQSNKQIIFNGYFLERTDITRFAIKCSEKNAEEICNIQQSQVPSNFFMIWTKELVIQSDDLVKDITNDVFNSI
jgi:hypothetical protein